MERHGDFVLKGHVMSYLRSSWNVEEIRCFRCGQLLQKEEVVHRRIKAGRLRIYHVACWDSMMIEIESEPEG